MGNLIRIKTNSTGKQLASLVCCTAAYTVSSIALASEGEEQFALIGESEIFFDGGGGTLTGIHNGIPYEIVQGYAVAQGDMVLGRVLPNGKLDVPAQTRGLGTNSPFDRWPDGVIPYQFADAVSQLQRDRAMQAVAHWNKHTRIQMIPRTTANADNYKNYISFELGGGCASYVGMKGGEQSVWLADNCTVGSIIHEIGHAIGLFHEHTRLDRDNYVTINLQNVSAGKEINFDIIDEGASTYSDYDYGSIMHYGEYFFSSNGEPSISVPDNIKIGQRDALSERDIASVNQMYATDLKLAVSTVPVENATQVDVVVTNAGNLGAFALVLTANWGEGTQWQSVSTNSGWNCQPSAADLRCTRPSLRELSDSSFSFRAAPNSSATIDTLKIRVESQTLDTDLTNNVFNDTIVAQTSEPEPQPEPPTPDETPDETPNEPGPQTPEITEPDTEQPLQPQDESTKDLNSGGDNTDTNTDNTTTDTLPEVGAAQSGGGAAFYLLVLLISTRLRRSIN